MTPPNALIERLTCDAATPELSRPDPARRVSGDPVMTVWNRDEEAGVSCGLWQCTPGAWRVRYTEWEYFYIRSGHSVLTDADGTQTQLRAGDSLVIRPGFSGVWEVLETTLKDYVIRA